MFDEKSPSGNDYLAEVNFCLFCLRTSPIMKVITAVTLNNSFTLLSMMASLHSVLIIAASFMIVIFLLRFVENGKQLHSKSIKTSG